MWPASLPATFCRQRPREGKGEFISLLFCTRLSELCQGCGCGEGGQARPGAEALALWQGKGPQGRLS